MDIKNNLSKIKELQKATAEVQAAANAVSRIKASQRLIELLKSMGVYDQNQHDIIGEEDEADDEYSDNTNDENYRYADTGYIAGSQKEKVGKRIKQLAKDGHTVKSTDIEWDEIEADELFAEDVIQKKNILGDIDYQAMKDAGGDAGTAFIIQKIFASIAPQPHWDIIYFLKNTNRGRSILRSANPKQKAAIIETFDGDMSGQKRLARKAYVTGINTLKERISNKTDVRSLVKELKEISQEMIGAQIGTDDMEGFLQAEKALDNHLEAIRERSKKFEAEYHQAELEAEKNLDMPKPSKKYGAAIPIYVNGKFEPYVGRSHYYNRRKGMLEWLKEQHPDVNFSTTNSSHIAPVLSVKSLMKYKELHDNLESIVIDGRVAGLKDPNAGLAWVSLGERFWNIVELTSSSFVKHANKALNKRYDDWGLTIKEANTDSKGKSKGKTKSTFELAVADKLTRKGGREVNVNSTEELKNTFGFRDIQSGNWVLKDKAVAKFHVESAAAAMMDLSDIVGIDAQSLAFGGRLALALGARGKKGAAAHYEPRNRIINISKMKGGGSLGHEWFHAIDNILAEVMNVDGGTSAGLFLSKDSSILGDSPLNTAFGKLRSAMLEGDIRAPESFEVTESLVRAAKLNLPDGDYLGKLQRVIKDNDATQAVIEVDKILTRSNGGKRSKNHEAWRRVAVAYHNQDKIGETITLNTGEPSSRFYAESKKLDEGRSKPYWSTTLEMAARAFQAFLEDSLKAQDRQNDYLSYGANNALYKNHNAYPDGAEREKINAVFTELFKVIKDERIFENAMEDEAMMDAIFGAKSIFFDEEQAAIDALFGDNEYHW